MGFIFILIPILILIGFLIWQQTKSTKYVLIYSAVVLVLFVLVPFVLLIIALATGESLIL